MTKPCFEQAHMTCAEFGLWVQYQKLAYKSGILYCDGRRTAERFGSESKSSIYRLRRSLIDKGWLEVIKESKRGEGGTYSPAEFKVLNHEQWTKKHGKKHCKTSIFEGLAPVPSTGTLNSTCPKYGNAPVPSTGTLPVPSTGHSTKGKPVLNTISFKSLRSPQEEPSKTESKTRSISREANLEPPVPSTGTLESKPEASEIFQAVQELDELDHAKAMSIYKRYTKDGKYPRTAEMLSIIRGTIAQTQEVSQ
jgi:hypothetical protein